MITELKDPQVRNEVCLGNVRVCSVSGVAGADGADGERGPVGPPGREGEDGQCFLYWMGQYVSQVRGCRYK